MKKLFIILLTILFIPKVYALTVTDVPIKDYVNDYGDILSDDVEIDIKKLSEELYNVDGTQIVVVTIKSLEGENLENFVHDLGNYYKIGKDSKGLIIFVSVEDRQARVEVGDNLEGILNDAKVGRFMDNYMIPYLKNDDWDNGIINVYNALRNEIIEENHLEIEKGNVDTTYEINHDDSPFIISIMISMFAVVTFGLILGDEDFINPLDILATLVIASPFFVTLVLKIEDAMYSLFYVGMAMFMYIMIRLGVSHGGGGGGSWSGGGGGHSSGGGFSGGGGHFSGGGASRGF